jgi:hypothetical protein
MDTIVPERINAMKTSSWMFVPSLFAVCLLSVLNSAGDQFSSVPREDFWLPGAGVVNAVAQANGVIYVGGGFQTVIPSPPSGVGAYDLNSGDRDPGFPLVNGQAWVVIPDNEGGWFIGVLLPPSEVSRLQIWRILGRTRPSI